MEALAYTHMCSVQEGDNPALGHGTTVFEKNNLKLRSSAWIYLLSAMMVFEILSSATSAMGYIARVRTNGSPLNVRTGPSTYSRVAYSLPNRTRVSLNGRYSDGWSQLYNRYWVASRYIGRRYYGSNVAYRPCYCNRYNRPYTYTDNGSNSGYTYTDNTSNSGYTYTDNGSNSGYNYTDNGSNYPNNGNNQPYNTTLRPGSRGSAVASLQQRLQDLNYFTGRVTGYYDSSTTAAVRNYQRNTYGLPQDGIAGPQTLASLGIAGSNNSGSYTYTG
jgi:uncharacterized protein YraI